MKKYLIFCLLFIYTFSFSQDIQLIKSLVQDHARRLALYHCANCGFKAKQFYWQCPACGLWDSFPAADKEQAILTKASYLS